MRGEVGRDRPADLLGRRVGRPQLGVGVLEGLEAPQPSVEVGVVEGRVVEHVVAPAGVLDLLGEEAVLLAGLVGRRRGDFLGRHLGHGSILPSTTDIRRQPPPTAWDASPHPSGDPGGSETRDVTAEQSREFDAHIIPAGRALTRLDVESPRAVALVLHGGKQSSRQPVDGRSASWKRMAAMQRTITPDLHAAGVSTWLLRYAVRGWNGGAPVVDARWALEQVRRELGDVPVVLLGHSMGGRTAAYVADDPSVVGVVALAPWWQPDDPVAALRGRPVERGARPQRQDHLGADDPRLPRACGRRGRFHRVPRHGPGRALHVPSGPVVERVRRDALPRPARLTGRLARSRSGPRESSRVTLQRHRWKFFGLPGMKRIRTLLRSTKPFRSIQ